MVPVVQLIPGQLVRTFLHFVATHCLLPSSQQSATGRSSEPDKSGLRFPTLIYLKSNSFHCLLGPCLPSSPFLSGLPVWHIPTHVFSPMRAICLLNETCPSRTYSPVLPKQI